MKGLGIGNYDKWIIYRIELLVEKSLTDGRRTLFDQLIQISGQLFLCERLYSLDGGGALNLAGGALDRSYRFTLGGGGKIVETFVGKEVVQVAGKEQCLLLCIETDNVET